MKWTYGKQHELRKLIEEEGLTAREAGLQMDVTRFAVLGACDRYSITMQNDRNGRPKRNGTQPVNLPVKSCEQAPSQPLPDNSGTIPHEEEEPRYSPSGCQYPQLDSGQRWTELKKAELKGNPPWHYCGEQRRWQGETYCAEHFRATH